jgi:hypothetical protein
MRPSPLTRRTPLGPGASSVARGSTFAAKPRAAKRRPISPASAEQRGKVKGMAGSIVSAQYPVDAAHVWPRGRGGCSDPLCVVPLTRAEHEAYDRGELDLLPYLLAHGLVAELQHALGHARGDLLGLLNLVTGERFAPERTAA